MANKAYFCIWITKYTGAHIQGCGHTALMDHLNKVFHAFAKANGVKKKRHFWNQGIQSILEEMTF